MTSQELGDPQGGSIAVLDPNRQRFKAFQQYPGIADSSVTAAMSTNGCMGFDGTATARHGRRWWPGRRLRAYEPDD
jgi:hypothetical protein